ncbi:MAG: hypothetical protein IKD46_05480 [Lentisphaeria bacterium]|nr:hypothetical protein [Lentisphaeria bacterium]
MTRCPYCDIEVSESAIEAEDGCCPECGTMLSTRSQFIDDDDYDDDDLDGVYDDLDEDDDYVDEDRYNDGIPFDDDDEFGDFDDEEFDDDDDF